MKKRILSLVGILAALFIATPVYATDAPDSAPSISDIKANVYLIENGDVLIYGLINIPYTTLPDDNAGKTYNIRLIGTDNVTQLGAVAPYPYSSFDKGYNLGVFAFYFSADDALTIDQAYIIRISQSPAFFDSPQSWDYIMPLSAWTESTTQDDNQTELTLNIISIAEELETYHDVTLLEDSVGGTVLSSPAGETYFRGAIYGIQAMAPDLFLVQSLSWDTTDRAWTTAQFDAYAATYNGTFIGTATDNTSATFGIDTGTMMAGLFLLPITLGAIIVSQIKWKKIEPGYMVGALVLICVALMGWVPAALFATVYQLFAMYIGYLIFYARASDSLGGKTLSFLAFVWIASIAICLVVEGSWIGGTEQTVINDLSAFTSLNIGGLVPIPAPSLYFFRGLSRVMLWDYSFYTGDFIIFRYVWLAVFTGSAVYAIFRDSASIFANFLRIR
jgi:hypothetical protein